MSFVLVPLISFNTLFRKIFYFHAKSAQSLRYGLIPSGRILVGLSLILYKECRMRQRAHAACTDRAQHHQGARMNAGEHAANTRSIHPSAWQSVYERAVAISRNDASQSLQIPSYSAANEMHLPPPPQHCITQRTSAMRAQSHKTPRSRALFTTRNHYLFLVSKSEKWFCSCLAAGWWNKYIGRRRAGRVSFARCHTRWARVEKQLFVSKGQRTLLINRKFHWPVIWEWKHFCSKHVGKRCEMLIIKCYGLWGWIELRFN